MLGFSRFDQMMEANVLSRMPAMARKPYDFVKSFMVSMGSPPRPATEQFENPSLANMMAQSFRRCTIF